MTLSATRLRLNARRECTLLIVAVGQLVLVAAVAAPLFVVLVQAARSGDRTIDPTLLRVLPRTVGIAASAAAMATILAIPASVVLGSAGRRSTPRSIVTGLVLLPLLTPSHVHVYLWQLLRTAFTEPGTLGPIGGVVTGSFGVAWVTACWLWPVPALLMAAGWRREGGAVYEVALLDLPPRRARLLAIRAVLLPFAVAAAAIVFAISCVEYTLPHLSIVSTYATELFLLTEQQRAAPASLMWQACPLMAPSVALVGVVIWLAARIHRQAVDVETPGARAGIGAALATVVVLALTFGLPLGYGVSLLSAPPAVAEAFRVFGPEWLSSLKLAGAVTALVFVSVMSVSALSAVGAARFAWMAAGLFAAAAPAALIGVAMINLFDSTSPLRTVYEQTPIVWWVASTARVVFIGLLAVAIGGGPADAGAEELARADGLTRWERTWYVRWPIRWPALLAASLAAGLISMSEVAVSTLVRPPGVSSIAVSLLNQMHFGRQDAVIASSLLTLIPAAASAVLLAVALRVRRGTS